MKIVWLASRSSHTFSLSVNFASLRPKSSGLLSLFEAMMHSPRSGIFFLQHSLILLEMESCLEQIWLITLLCMTEEWKITLFSSFLQGWIFLHNEMIAYTTNCEPHIWICINTQNYSSDNWKVVFKFCLNVIHMKFSQEGKFYCWRF